MANIYKTSTSSTVVPTANSSNTTSEADYAKYGGAKGTSYRNTSTDNAAAIPTEANSYMANDRTNNSNNRAGSGSMVSSSAAAAGEPVADAVAEAAATTAPKYAVNSETSKATQQYLNDYNANREQKIRDMYAGNLASQNAQQQTAYDKNMGALRTAYEANLGNLKTAYDNNTDSLKTAYDKNLATLANAYQQNMSDAEAYREGISPRYQESMNALGAEYERQRRNNNMQAAVNGINTGAGSQMALGQSMAYQKNQGNLARSENEALNEADRGINDLNRDYTNRQAMLDTEYTNNVDRLNREYANQQATYGTTYQNNLLDLKTNYQNKIAEAAANNDYQLAAALLDEYGAQYDRTMQQAEQLAQFGDFSMYASIYGIDAAQEMERMWSMQNPDLAYNLGRMTADEYFNLTGKYPSGYTGMGTGVYGSDYAEKGPGYFVRGEDGKLKYAHTPGYDYTHVLKNMPYGRGYSASRDRAYRGPAGSYVNGVWTPGASSGDTSSGGNDYANPVDVGAAANSAFYNSYRDNYGGF